MAAENMELEGNHLEGILFSESNKKHTEHVRHLHFLWGSETKVSFH